MNLPTEAKRQPWPLMLGALGVVFGDIGTSPLYALRECFNAGHHALALNPTNVIGLLSVIFWVLVLVISVEYVTFILRADNNGEGGILALMALVVRKFQGRERWRDYFVLVGLIGAALLFADAMITPAISVLSAVEGLKVATPIFGPYVVPAALFIIVSLYAVQSYGTARIGKVFGPVMLLWFSTLGVIGIISIAQTPAVLAALNPLNAVQFFLHNGWVAFLAMGSVFLVVTGGEALYADMGHFGRPPIRNAWFCVALPGLALNYFGQGALLLREPEALEHLFFSTVPGEFLIPLVLLATCATVIASQAVISGAFSVASSAVQLGYIPRLDIRQTSSDAVGQVYLPAVNWSFLAGTVGLVLWFENSSNLAAAYGVAVATTMLATTFFLCFVARYVWGWSRYASLALAFPFLCIDSTFFVSNLAKIPAGGWLPVLFACGIYTLMATWKQGRQALNATLSEENLDLSLFVASLEAEAPLRVPGVAIFLTGQTVGVPRALLHNMKHNRVLHQSVVLLTVETARVPHVMATERVSHEVVGQGISRMVISYGFLERPNLPRELRRFSSPEFTYDEMETTFFLGRETVLVVRGKRRLARWRRILFAIMLRNAASAARFFHLPPNRVVEIGAQVEI
jgi:KUP system potassium uptake protein